MSMLHAMLTHKTFVHRGMWDDRHPENSLGAFARAVAAGYGMECDVRMSADGVPFVFHDAACARMTGYTGTSDAHTMAQLRAMRLRNTVYNIPSLGDVLRTVDGRVPLLLEIKTRRTHRAVFADAVTRTLAHYDGPFAVSSFDVGLARAIKRRMPQVAVGYHCSDYPDSYPVIATARRWGAAALLRASGFVPDFFVVRATYLDCYGDPRRTDEADRPLLTWGVRDDAQWNRIRQYGVNSIRDPIA